MSLEALIENKNRPNNSKQTESIRWPVVSIVESDGESSEMRFFTSQEGPGFTNVEMGYKDEYEDGDGKYRWGFFCTGQSFHAERLDIEVLKQSSYDFFGSPMTFDFYIGDKVYVSVPLMLSVNKLSQSFDLTWDRKPLFIPGKKKFAAVLKVGSRSDSGEVPPIKKGVTVGCTLHGVKVRPVM